MLGQSTRYIVLSLIFILSLTGRAQTAVDSLKSRLAEADNLQDSIVLLYNIYDSSPHSLQDKTLEEIYELAMRRADYHTANGVLRLSSNYYITNDSMQQVLIDRAEKLPDSAEKQSTLVYLNVMKIFNQVRSNTNDQNEAKLCEYLAQHDLSEKYDTYKRIEYLFILCKYLSLSTDGELLISYLQELQTLIDNLPPDDLALKYLFYSQAAQSYLSRGMIREAIEANKTLLGVIEKFENLHTTEWHVPHNYDRQLVICYNRLLQCHDSLPQDDIDEYYSHLTTLIDSNPTIPNISVHQNKATIYYLMAKKRYADAIPLIKEQLDDSTNTYSEQLYLVDALLKAAEAVGDKEDLLRALEMSNTMFKDRIKNKAAESYKELQIIYDVNDLKHTNDELLIANQQSVINRHKQQLIYAIISFVVLVILLVIVFVLYRRSKKLTHNLTKANAMIIDERDALQRTQKELIEASEKVKVANRIKTDFIKNIGHEIRNPLEFIVEHSGLIAECVDKDRSDYIKRFADVITLNSDLLLTYVNDVLELPSLENAKVSVHIMKSSVQNICKAAIDNVIDHIKPGVDLIFVNDGEADATIMTDSDRVEQVLMNLLMNAAKFTEEGSITLKYAISPKLDKITFTVTDTGTGISKGQEKIIFSRLKKSESNDSALGLYHSRLIANMLGGNLTLDDNYHTGAKFIFTITIS